MFDSKELPDLDNELGPIAEKEQVCPGVYFLSAKNDDELLSRDYYAVMEESPIPLKAKSYGHKLSGLWLFSADDEECQIIKYETAKYRAQNHLPLDETGPITNSARVIPESSVRKGVTIRSMASGTFFFKNFSI